MTLTIKRVVALPPTPQLIKSCLYLVRPEGSLLFKIYVVDDAGTVVEHFHEDHVIEVINRFNFIILTDTITTRDALALTRNSLVLVRDATLDTTVKSGGAMYFYEAVDNIFVKVMEFEGLDFQTYWDNIQNKPTSSVTQIDSSVQNTHSHINKQTLDNLKEEADILFYKNSPVSNVIFKTPEW